MALRPRINYYAEQKAEMWDRWQRRIIFSSDLCSNQTTLAVKLSLVPAFQSLDKIPSPSQLDFDNIEISDDALQSIEAATGVAVVAAASAAGLAEAATASKEEAAELDVTGTYEAEISYTSTMALADRRWFFGANPDIEFTLTQKGNKISGEFSDDRDGKIIKGKIDDDEITFTFYLEALGGETKDGAGNWIVGEDGTLKGDFKIRDPERGVIRGFWTLTKIE